MEVAKGRVVVNGGGVEEPGALNPNTCLEDAVTKFLGENNPLRGDLYKLCVVHNIKLIKLLDCI